MDSSSGNGSEPFSDELEDSYRAQIKELIAEESNRILYEKNDPAEESRLLSLSLMDQFLSGEDLVSPLMARLGPVRAALDGHGGGLVVSEVKLVEDTRGKSTLSLVLDLDGACVSCGAAPGTLKGIQDDLLMDNEVSSVRFSSSMLEWFDDIQREFVITHGGVTFV
ncbi:MAG: hypothetical protein CMB67_02555 [Euryarchaeota archaeon]|nr:hypothetical protein [Euryarchaeota archaeon]